MVDTGAGKDPETGRIDTETGTIVIDRIAIYEPSQTQIFHGIHSGHLVTVVAAFDPRMVHHFRKRQPLLRVEEKHLLQQIHRLLFQFHALHPQQSRQVPLDGNVLKVGIHRVRHGKRLFPNQQFKKNDSHGPQIDGEAVKCIALENFRRHVFPRAPLPLGFHQSSRGVGTDVGDEVSVVGVHVGHSETETEINDFDVVAFVHEYIFHAEISMAYPLFLQLVESREDLAEPFPGEGYVYSARGRKPHFFQDPFVEIASGDEGIDAE
mmetsp:Transcript_16852/g.35375  ORF Transcript_16852/g.35375 Transcript_16852/m.35375 type:complete len:265 (+) Transcript_16852:544-1338(+)